MAEDKNKTFAEPENCAHDCSSCGAGCEYNPNQGQGKFWEALDTFSEISSDDLLNALKSLGEDEEEA
jgi:hypothetical protein